MSRPYRITNITFTVGKGTPRREETFFRNPRCTEWSSYAADLGGRLKTFPPRYGSPGEIDIATNMLRDAIAAYEENCPLKRRSESDVKWWNAETAKTCKVYSQSGQEDQELGSLGGGKGGPKGVQEGHKEGQETVVA